METYESLLHWYQSDHNKILATGIQRNIQRFLGRVFENKNDGAYVSVSTRSDHKGISSAKEIIKYFATEVLDLLPQYWPAED